MRRPSVLLLTNRAFLGLDLAGQEYRNVAPDHLRGDRYPAVADQVAGAYGEAEFLPVGESAERPDDIQYLRDDGLTGETVFVADDDTNPNRVILEADRAVAELVSNVGLYLRLTAHFAFP